MGKEIRVDADPEHVRAFSEAVKKHPKIDFERFNPHLAARCRIAEQLASGKDARLSASANGGHSMFM